MKSSQVETRPKVKLNPNAEALREFVAMRSASYFGYCTEICLGNSTHARDLFERVIREGINHIKDFFVSEDMWFYRNLHQVLPSFVRFKRELKSASDGVSVNWKRVSDTDRHQILRRLNIDEREIYLHRMLNKFGSDRVSQIVLLEAPKVAEIFQNAIAKVV